MNIECANCYYVAPMSDTNAETVLRAANIYYDYRLHGNRQATCITRKSEKLPTWN